MYVILCVHVHIISGCIVLVDTHAHCNYIYVSIHTAHRCMCALYVKVYDSM